MLMKFVPIAPAITFNLPALLERLKFPFALAMFTRPWDIRTECPWYAQQSAHQYFRNRTPFEGLLSKGL